MKALPQLCREALLAVLYPKQSPPKSYSSTQRILLRLSEEYCNLYIEHDARHVTPFEIIELENEQDYFYDFRIQVAGQTQSVRLKGIIDRIDQVNGVVRIVDYKTGRDELEFRAAIDEAGGYALAFFGKNWKDSNKALIQTLYYTYIYQQVTGKRHVEPNLYVTHKLRNEGSLFKIKIPYKGVHDLAGGNLEQAKQQFEEFLQSKLEELFDPTVPFMHNPEATVYESSPYMDFFTKEIDYSDPDENGGDAESRSV